MDENNKRLLGIAAAGISMAALLNVGVVEAQVSLTTVPHANPTDLVPDIVKGQPTAQGHFATVPQVSGLAGYVFANAVTTTSTISFAAAQQYEIINNSASIAALTLVTETNPGDGQLECVFNNAAVGTLTWSASTGQTIGSNVVGTLAAQVSECIIYDAAKATWYQAR